MLKFSLKYLDIKNLYRRGSLRRGSTFHLPPAGVFWPAKKLPRWSQAQLKAAIRQRKYLLSLERLDIGFNSGDSSMNSPAIIFHGFTFGTLTKNYHFFGNVIS